MPKKLSEEPPSDSESDDDESGDDEQEIKTCRRSSVKKSKRPDDIGSCVIDACKKVNYKIAGFLFVIFMLVTSTTFIDGVLGKYNGCVNGVSPTLKGTGIQALALVLGFILIDILTSSELI